jgi:hypothetical protein
MVRALARGLVRKYAWHRRIVPFERKIQRFACREGGLKRHV